MTLSFDDLLLGFLQTGIQPDDLVMLHSSYKSLGGVEGGAETVVRALHEAVFPNGAVFFPRYTVASWCGGRYFDEKETPGEMGIIPEIAAQTFKARTRHPIHNFQVAGKWRDAFQFDNRESFSDRGPFGLFHRENGLVVSIGVPWNDTISFVHYVEQQAGAEFRRVKNFGGLYVDHAGRTRAKTCQMSVRKTQNHITHVAPLYDEVLVPAGVVKQMQIGTATVSYFRCQEYYDAVAPLVKERPELFHYYEGYQARETAGKELVR